jgi:hypothetical protein
LEAKSIPAAGTFSIYARHPRFPPNRQFSESNPASFKPRKPARLVFGADPKTAGPAQGRRIATVTQQRARACGAATAARTGSRIQKNWPAAEQRRNPTTLDAAIAARIKPKPHDREERAMKSLNKSLLRAEIPSGAKQAAEKGLNLSESPKNIPRGLKPC